ncbi:MAG TPA: serine hydrolase, partial [Phenylobacterium sp.]
MRRLTIKGIMLAGLLALAAPASRAQTPTPAAPTAAAPVAETPASDRARRMLKAAAESGEAFIAFAHEASPNRPRPDDEWLAMRSQLKSFHLHAVDQASATHAEITGFDSDIEMWIRLSIDVTAEPPHTITNYGLRRAPRPADVAPPPRLAPAALAAATRARMEAAAKADAFSGAVLIEQGGKPILDAAYGLADREARTPNTTQTQFRFGSMGK